MAQNYYEWASERAITAVAPSPFSYTQGMYEFSDLNHLVAPILLPCEVCGLFGHTSVECRLGSVVKSPEQVNYAQFNQGFKNNQNFYQNPQNLFGQQTILPDCANNPRVHQKSDLELLIENFILCQTEQHKELKNQTRILNDSLTELTSKVDSIATHTKMLETQISQIAQQVSQTETNDVTLRDGRQLEEPQLKDNAKESEKVSDKPQSDEADVESEKQNIPTPYKPIIPFPQRPDESRLDEQFRKFVEYSETIQKKLPPKLKDPENSSIPCVIGSETIGKAMGDLGASVSLMPLSLRERLGIG